jgi:hypothetical protein
MNSTHPSAACGRCIVVIVALGGFLSSLAAQNAPAAPAPAPADATKKPIPVETAPAANAPGSDDAIALSPFEVTSNTKGYYASSTMSGTRFNTKLDDLASSVTVITKEQMSDFAMLDINDIFLYTANTEGTGTYTDFVIDRNGSVADNVQLNPNNANRVRGIAPANVSLGNIETMNRVPVDPIGIDAIEVSRGPNANVFGLGNPSGTLNQVAAAANTTRDRTQAQFRADSYEGYRESLDMNRVLLKNKLAVRFSEVFQHDGYVRKPSGTNTVRYSGMIKYQPFKSTTIAASYSFYRLNGNRPNSLPPRDNISYWIANGRPTWDPTTQQIHINGATVGTFTNPSYNGPDYFSASILGATRNQMFIDRNGLSYWSMPGSMSNVTPLPGTTVAGPTSGPQAVRFLQTTGTGGATGFAATPASQPLFSTTPTIRDKSIYDWSSINLSAPNRLIDRVLTSNVQIDQRFFDTARHALFGQAAFLREDAQRYARNLIGAANDLGQSGQLEIDPNERLLDGSPNPYFLRPFIGTDKPRTVLAPAKWDTYRAQLAYKLDFARDSGWRHWLGTHQVAGYGEYKYRINRQYSFRDVITSPNPWLPPGVYRANQFQPPNTPTVIGITQGFYRYYVSDKQGPHVDYAPQEFAYGSYPFVWGNATTRVWNRENSTLAPGASTDSSGGASNVKQILKTGGAVIHSHFLNERLVVTYGQREDKVYSKFGNPTPQLLNSDGLTFNYPLINSWAGGDYRYNTGKTKNTQFVVRPFRGLPILASLEQAGGAGRFAADALRGLSLNYNKSDSFTPATPAQDLFLNVLPNPSGEDRSWGFGLNMLDGRAVLRVTRYQNAQRNGRNGDTSTIAQRIIRTDLAPATTTPSAFVLQGQVTNWVTQDPAHASWTQVQIQAEVAKQMGLSTTLQNELVNPSPPIAATQDIVAKGTEVELNLNLKSYWTVAASATDTQSITNNVSSAVSQWAAQRMAIWTTIKDPRGPDHVFGTADDGPVNWWTQNYGGTQTAAQNYAVSVDAPYNVLKQKEGKTNPQIRRYAARFSTNFRLAGVTTHRLWKNVNVGGALRWEDRGAIGYYGIQDANGTYVALDPNKPIYNRAHAYVDAFVGYRTKIFADKIGATFQLNVQNLQESGGRLQPTGAFPDGTKNAFRIIDPRKFILTATFDL